MSQIGAPVKVVEIPRPIVAPAFTPPERREQPTPMEPIQVPEFVPARAPAAPEKRHMEAAS